MTDGIVKIIGVPITRDKTFDEQLNLRPDVKACPDEADFTYELDEENEQGWCLA